MMATIHPTQRPDGGAASGTASAQSAQQVHPHIDIAISTSSPTLDLTTRTKFSLTITFTLRNSPQPIALFESSSPLLELVTALTPLGLTFTDARTGCAPGPLHPPFHHSDSDSASNHPRCTLGQYQSTHDDDNDSGPPYPTEMPLTYLQPDVPWSVTHTLGPAFRAFPRVWVGPDGLLEHAEGPEEACWFGTEALQEGVLYEVGMAEEGVRRGVRVFERVGGVWEVLTEPVRVAAGALGGGGVFRRFGEGRWVARGVVPVVVVETGMVEFRGVPEGVEGVRQWP